MNVLSPRSLDEALRLKTEHPEAVPIQGGTDVMVELNFDRSRPDALLNLNEVPELRGWSRENGTLRLGSGLTYTEAMQAPLAATTPSWPRRRARSARRRSETAARSAATSGRPRPPGTRCRRCSPSTPRSSWRARAATRTLPLREFLVGPKRNALGPDELIVAVRRPAARAAADVHEDRAAQRDGDRGLSRSRSRWTRNATSCARSFGSAGPVPGIVTASLDERDGFPDRVAEAASPIDDVRGTAEYRRHALRVLTARALERCLA